MRRRTLWSAAALLVTSVTASVSTLAPAGPAAAAAPPAGFTDAFVTDVSRATAVEWLPSDEIAVLEQQTGRVRVGAPGRALATVLDLAVCGNSERGLLGLVPDPAFLTNRHVYVYYTAPVGGGCVNRVSRFTLAGAAIAPGTELILLDNIASTGGNHNGGDLDIDEQGNLLVAIGDAGRDPRGNSGSGGSNDAAQDLSLLNGKILRITRDGRPASGNPFAGAGTSRCSMSGVAAPSSTMCREIYAWGLRNPYRIAVDRNAGSGRFFVNDVGQNTFEEVNVGRAGADYGWPAREGACQQGRTTNCSVAPFGVTDPITAYGRSLGSYITAGAFVPNGLWPSEYDGGYLFADGGSGNIWLRTAAGAIDYGAPFATGAFGVTDMTFGFDADGVMVLYYVQVGGGLRMIRPDGVPAGPTNADLKLVPVESFRAFDSGDAAPLPAGRVFNGTTRVVDLDPPAGATAALVNLTYDATEGAGFVRAWAARTRRPLSSSLNADRAGTIAANAAVVALAPDGSFVLESSTTARVVVDVMAWFVSTSGSSDDGRFVASDPGRLVDTRIPAGDTLDSGSPNPFVRAAGRFDIDVAGQLDVPDDDTVAAVVIGVATIGRLDDQAGFVGGHPSGTAWPGTSNANVSPGEVRANMMVIPLGADGGISLTAFDVADVAVDLLGYVTSDAAPSSGSGLYTTLAPVRTVDTRIPLGTNRLAPLTPARVSVPAAAVGASAVAQNLTATNTAGAGYLAAHPGPTPPVVSSVNYDGVNHTRAAFAFTSVAADGSEYLTSFVAADAVVDVVGFFSP